MADKKYLDESTLTYLRNYIDAQDKVIYKAASDKLSEAIAGINQCQCTNTIESIDGLLEYLTQFGAMIEKAANAAAPIQFDCENTVEAATTFHYGEEELENGQYESILRGFYAKLVDAQEEYASSTVGNVYMTPICRGSASPTYNWGSGTWDGESYELIKFTGTDGTSYNYSAEVKIKDLAEIDEDNGLDNEIVGKSIEISITQTAIPEPAEYEDAEDASF